MRIIRGRGRKRYATLLKRLDHPDTTVDARPLREPSAVAATCAGV